MGTLKFGVHKSAGRRNFPFQECVYSWLSRSRDADDLSQSAKYLSAVPSSLDR
jgi:hypothetical protein